VPTGYKLMMQSEVTPDPEEGGSEAGREQRGEVDEEGDVVAQADVDIPGCNLGAPFSGPLFVLVTKTDTRDHDLIVDELPNRFGAFQGFLVDIDTARHRVVLAQHVAQAANPQFSGALKGIILAARGPQWRVRFLEGFGDDLAFRHVKILTLV